MISRIIPASFGAAALALFSLGCSATEERAGYQPVTATAADAARPLLMSRPRDREEPVRQAQYEDEWQAAPPPPGEEERPSSLRDSTPSSDPPLSNSDGFLMDEPLDLAIGSNGMTLEALQQLALNNNPAILQGSSAANKAAGIRTQVGLGPNPTIGYSGQEIGNDGAAGLHAAFVSQTFVRGGKLAANQDVVGHEQQAILWQVEALRHRVRTDIKTRFYEALAAQERIRLARQFLEVANEGVKTSEDRIEAQVGTRPDLLQSEIQVTEVELAIRRAEFAFEAAWKELVAIAGVPDMPPAELVGSLNIPAADRDMESVYAQIEAESPAIRSAEARVRRAKANMYRQQIQPIPNVTGQFGLGYDDGTGDGFANVQLSLPVPVRNRNEGNTSAAHAEFCEATQNVQRLKMQLRARLAAVLREYQSAATTVQQYESAIIPKAEETLQLILKAQEAGEIGFLRVLTARRSVFEANQQYVSAQAQLAQADAVLGGLLLTGALSNVPTYEGSAGLRGQALSGQ